MLITRRLPYAGLRVRRGHVETAIHTFRRMEDGRTITLIGTQHVGEPDYFAELRKVIDEVTAAGAVVHWDLLRGKSADAEAAAQTSAERAAFGELNRETLDTTPNTPKRIGLGWVRQVEGLPPGPDWVNTDVTAVDMVRLLGPVRASRRRPSVGARMLETVIAKYEADLSDANRRFVQACYYSQLKKSVRRRARGIADPVRAAVVGTWRECNAVAVALAETRDVVMVWGAGHLAGFAAILLRNGFGLASTRWVFAAREPAKAKQPR